MEEPDAVDVVDLIQQASDHFKNPFVRVRFWHFHDGTEYELIRIFADSGEIHFDLVEKED